MEFWKLSTSVVTDVDKSLKLKVYVLKRTVMKTVFLAAPSKNSKLN